VKWKWLIIGTFGLISLRLVCRDFYYDECYSIDHYLFAPLIDVATKYDTLNNHFLFSLLSNAYLKIVGIVDIGTVLEHPWLLRLPLLVFPISCLWLISRLGKRTITGKGRMNTGWLPALLLATTVPFYYYGVAVRGYAMSMALYLALLVCVQDRRMVAAAFCAAAFAYVMPSNVVLLVATVAWYTLLRDTGAIGALCAGLVFAGAAYFPVGRAILHDPQMSAHNAHWRIVTESIPEMANAFLSYRWLLIPLAAYGFIRTGFRSYWLGMAVCVTGLSLAAFVVSGNYLWARVMLPTLPLWCLATADGLTGGIHGRPNRKQTVNT
jgi:hypothetical protein